MAAAIAATGLHRPRHHSGGGGRQQVLSHLLGGISATWEVTSMSSEFGHLLKISVFGQSHGAAIGVVMDGLPAGEAVDLDAAPGLSGPAEDPAKRPLHRPEGGGPPHLPLRIGKRHHLRCAAVCRHPKTATSTPQTTQNSGTSPGPAMRITPRLSSGRGQADMRGGGHFSGRLTAPLHRRRHRQADPGPGDLRGGAPSGLRGARETTLSPPSHGGAF